MLAKYGIGASLVSTLAMTAYAFMLRAEVAEQKLVTSAVTVERDNLLSELTTAEVRLEQSQRAHMRAAESLSRATAASRELDSIKAWVKDNEDAPIPDWFSDLLVRLGFSVRNPRARN